MNPAPVATDDRLLVWREEFPTLAGTLHFISHSLGAMPRGAEASLLEYARIWRTRSIRAWDEAWYEFPTVAGNLIGAILGADPGTISMHPNVTSAQAVALSAMEWKAPRNKLVCTAEDFPSVMYLYEGLERHGVEVVRVPARDGHRIDENDIVAAIDERTAVVAISHVLFRTAQILDLAPILARARAAGALALIDAYQSVGTVPVDVKALDVDMLCGGSVKWLCGGPGASYLYVSPRIAPSRKPAFTGWMGHQEPFDFEARMQWHDGARRFWNGTPAVPAIFAARSGYEIVGQVGVPAIREKSLRQTARMLAWADEYGFPVISPRGPEQRGGTVVIDVPHADVVCDALLATDVMLDFRPGVGLRLAPHFYTRDDEVDEVMKRVRNEVKKAGG